MTSSKIKERGVMNKSPRIILFLISLFSFLLFLSIWEYLVDSGTMSSRILASPREVVATAIIKLTDTAPDGATLPQHIQSSMILAVTGYVVAAGFGAILGLLMGWFKRVDRIVQPLFEIFRPIPPISWIPLSILWFGIGLQAKAFIIFYAAFVPSVINSYAGIKMTDPTLINVGKTCGASNFKIFFRIGIPYALPMVFTGLRLSLNSAWMTLVGAELLAATSGLGYMIQMGRSYGRPDIIIVGMLVIGLLGALMSFVLTKAEHHYNRGRKA
ncbi:MAG: ABC transporter permease [Negativicutes bacterium]|nr:ABC transporter permease [Negativicutes bacterium]